MSGLRSAMTRPLESQAWTRENIAWAAGFYEGEGSLSTKGNNRNWRLSLSSTDRDVIDRWASIFPGGSIYAPNMATYPRSYKQQFIWQLNGNRRVYAVVVTLFPWLGVRRRERIADFMRGAF